MRISILIWLDLGIAGTRTSPGDESTTSRMTSIRSTRFSPRLSTLVDGVQRELAEIWPVLALLGPRRREDRRGSSKLQHGKSARLRVGGAEILAPLGEADRMSSIDNLDKKKVVSLAYRVLKPGLITWLLMGRTRSSASAKEERYRTLWTFLDRWDILNQRIRCMVSLANIV